MHLYLDSVVISFFLLFGRLKHTLHGYLVLFVGLRNRYTSLVLRYRFFRARFVLRGHLKISRVLYYEQFLTGYLVRELFSLYDLFLTSLAIYGGLYSRFLVRRRGVFIVIIYLNVFVSRVAWVLLRVRGRVVHILVLYTGRITGSKVRYRLLLNYDTLGTTARSIYRGFEV